MLSWKAKKAVDSLLEAVISLLPTSHKPPMEDVGRTMSPENDFFQEFDIGHRSLESLP